MLRKLTSFLFLPLLLLGCTLQANSNNGYPSAKADLATAWPTPTATLPTPDMNTGVVKGQVVSRTSEFPLTGMAIYLGEKLPSTSGSGYVITLQERSSPHTLLGEDGRFALAAPPREYVLIVWTPIKSKVITDPTDQNKELLIVVKAGETVDLGIVKVDWP